VVKIIIYVPGTNYKVPTAKLKWQKYAIDKYAIDNYNHVLIMFLPVGFSSLNLSEEGSTSSSPNFPSFILCRIGCKGSSGSLLKIRSNSAMMLPFLRQEK
jgi:hypothetical protein